MIPGVRVHSFSWCLTSDSWFQTFFVGAQLVIPDDKLVFSVTQLVIPSAQLQLFLLQ